MLEIVERLCTHVGIIVKGELVEQASLETIRQGGLAGRVASCKKRGPITKPLASSTGSRRRRRELAALADRSSGSAGAADQPVPPRGGALNAVLIMIAIAAAVTAIPPSIACFVARDVCDPKAPRRPPDVCVGRG